MPHSFGLSAVDTTPRLAPLIMLRSPSKLLLYRNRMKSVSVRLLQHTPGHQTSGCDELWSCEHACMPVVLSRSTLCTDNAAGKHRGLVK